MRGEYEKKFGVELLSIPIKQKPNVCHEFYLATGNISSKLQRTVIMCDKLF